MRMGYRAVTKSGEKKRCRLCDRLKSLSEFTKNKTNRDRLKHECRSCCRIKRQKYYLANRKKEIKKVREWITNNYQRQLKISRKSARKRRRADPMGTKKKDEQRRQAGNKERRAEINRRYYQRNKKKFRARDLARQALRKGLITKRPCKVCNSPESQMHHPDYRKAYQIEWLCSLHHGEQHQKD